ncbi:MAG TPA: hypothetical protein VJ953_04540 [Saprospiraceae bacterium]|nr:hypothetical protein [Saprospiraceae bacterium]
MSTPRYITKEELQSIFTALEERNTKYYDLQVELVNQILAIHQLNIGK